MSRKSPFSNLSMRIMGEKSGTLTFARGRIVLVATLFLLFYVLIAGRLVDAILIEGYWRQHQEGSEQKKEAVLDDKSSGTLFGQDNEKAPRRADIVDRNGVLLATSLKTASLHADPKLILDAAETAKGLTHIFPDMTYGETLKKLQSDKRFVWIRRNLTPNEQKKILELGEPGLVFDYSYRRIYPQGSLSGHMVGYTDIDGKGLGGVERSFNKLLETSQDTLELTLDMRFQHVLRREVKKAMTDFNGIAGSGIIMDVRSGEVLAATSLPDFDPNGKIDDPSSSVMFNRNTSGVYELGSTFKIFTTAALLDRVHPSFNKRYDASSPIHEGNHIIHDYHPENRPLTIPEIFMVSSNIGTAHMAQDIGTEGLKKFFADLGLMSKPEFEIEEVGGPIIPRPWSNINTLTASYGHGIAVTPLQMVAAVSTVVNGGIKVKPILVRRTGESASQNSEKIQVVSKETSLKMRQLLRLVVASGTARKADVPGYMIGGKTGTAQKNVHGRYVADKRIAAFVGIFPVNDPQYAVFVMVDEPKPNKDSYGYATAGWVAVPATGRIISGIGPLIGMVPDKESEDISEPLRQFVSTSKGEH
ncbi:MAG: penicillin-binding protein 2 [Pseudobdellovibrionaceae bacterium]